MEARNAQDGPTTKTYLAQNVNSVEIKNLPYGGPGGGVGWGGMNWEIGIDMYTLMCIKLMTNKKKKEKKSTFIKLTH